MKHETRGQADNGVPFTWLFVTFIRQGQPTCLTTPAAAPPISVHSWLPQIVPVRSRCPSRGPRHNQVHVQPNEHHALELTCKHVAEQVANEVAER